MNVPANDHDPNICACGTCNELRVEAQKMYREIFDRLRYKQSGIPCVVWNSFFFAYMANVADTHLAIVVSHREVDGGVPVKIAQEIALGLVADRHTKTNEFFNTDKNNVNMLAFIDTLPTM